MFYKTDISNYNPASNVSRGLQLHHDYTNNAKYKRAWRYLVAWPIWIETTA